MVKNDGFISVGDASPLTNGGKYIKKVGDHEYSIISFQLMEDRKGYNYFVVVANVDVTDDWIDWKKVYSFTGTDGSFPEVDRAIAAYDTYETDLSEGQSEIVERKKYMKAYLKGFGITSGLK